MVPSRWPGALDPPCSPVPLSHVSIPSQTSLLGCRPACAVRPHLPPIPLAPSSYGLCASRIPVLLILTSDLPSYPKCHLPRYRHCAVLRDHISLSTSPVPLAPRSSPAAPTNGFIRTSAALAPVPQVVPRRPRAGVAFPSWRPLPVAQGPCLPAMGAITWSVKTWSFNKHDGHAICSTTHP